MNMPRPTDAHQRLAVFEGRWEGQDTMAPSHWDPEGSTVPARHTLQMGLDGFVLLRDYSQLRDGKQSFGGHGVVWWDAEAEQYLLHWWDSMGGVPNVFRGGFEGDELVLVDHGERGSTRGRMQVKGDTLVHQLEMSQDGETWKTFMRGEYQRKG